MTLTFTKHVLFILVVVSSSLQAESNMLSSYEEVLAYYQKHAPDQVASVQAMFGQMDSAKTYRSDKLEEDGYWLNQHALEVGAGFVTSKNQQDYGFALIKGHVQWDLIEENAVDTSIRIGVESFTPEAQHQARFNRLSLSYSTLNPIGSLSGITMLNLDHQWYAQQAKLWEVSVAHRVIVPSVLTSVVFIEPWVAYSRADDMPYWQGGIYTFGSSIGLQHQVLGYPYELSVYGYQDLSETSDSLYAMSGLGVEGHVDIDLLSTWRLETGVQIESARSTDNQVVGFGQVYRNRQDLWLNPYVDMSYRIDDIRLGGVLEYQRRVSNIEPLELNQFQGRGYVRWMGQ